MRRFLTLATTATALLATTAAAAAQDSTIRLTGPTTVRAWGGTAVLSVLDPSTRRWRLATQRGTMAPRELPGITGAARAFDADIGPGPGGAPLIVFVRCPATGHCHLARTTPAGGREIPIPGSAATRGSESAPTIWGNRLAFARRYDVGGSQRVYVRPLDAGRNVRSTALPGVPARECLEVQPRCRPVVQGTVRELELRGTTLVENIHFPLASVGICGEGQLRLVNVARRSSHLISSTVCGLSGSTLLGASPVAGFVLYVQRCLGDPGPCHGPALVHRYRLRDGRSDERPLSDDVTGFSAVDADHAVVVRLPQDATGTWDLVRTGSLVFQPNPNTRGAILGRQ